MSKTTGTKEWAVRNVNLVLGCAHKCRYCYARADALRFKRIADPEDWGERYHKLRIGELDKPREKVEGTVMFPSTHDIEPRFLQHCIGVLRKLLQVGNQVLIVSKPHWECIAEIDRALAVYKKQVTFRFTIGAADDELLGYWEPGAPRFDERLMCLRRSFWRGWATSVSIEPMLDGPNVVELFARLEPFVSDNNSIWVGKMRNLRQRCIPGTSEEAMRLIEAGQTDQRIMEIYEALKDRPKVRWKDSIRDVVRKMTSRKHPLTTPGRRR